MIGLKSEFQEEETLLFLSILVALGPQDLKGGRISRAAPPEPNSFLHPRDLTPRCPSALKRRTLASAVAGALDMGGPFPLCSRVGSLSSTTVPLREYSVRLVRVNRELRWSRMVSSLPALAAGRRLTSDPSHFPCSPATRPSHF